MTTERIDHAAEALTHIQFSWDSDDIDRGNNHMAEAQVHATLALVEQQRIANVIAMATAEVLHDLRFSEDDRAAIDREGAR